MTEKEIAEMAFDWSVDYKPWEEDLSPQKYAEYGFIQGMKRAFESMSYKLPPGKGGDMSPEAWGDKSDWRDTGEMCG